MTTARKSPRGKTRTALAAALVVLAASRPSAHRRDEYLQAARLAVDPARVEIELDLTPGIELAQGILDEIDRNRDGAIAADEAQAYAARVLKEIRLEVDDHSLPLVLTGTRFPAEDAVLRGEGTIRLELSAAVPPLAAGAHRVFYRNDHHGNIGVYLANALVPENDRVAIGAQRRDGNQRELVIEYKLHDEAARPFRWWLPASVAGAVVMMVGVLWRRT